MRRKPFAAFVLAAVLVLTAMAPTSIAAAAESCAPRLQTYFASDFTDSGYQQKAYQKVAGAWKRPPTMPAPGSKAVVITTITRDGKAALPMLHMKSGSDAWDAAAIAAVKHAIPFEPLPKEYARSSVEVHFHFVCDKQP